MLHYCLQPLRFKYARGIWQRHANGWHGSTSATASTWATTTASTAIFQTRRSVLGRLPRGRRIGVPFVFWVRQRNVPTGALNECLKKPHIIKKSSF